MKNYQLLAEYVNITEVEAKLLIDLSKHRPFAKPEQLVDTAQFIVKVILDKMVQDGIVINSGELYSSDTEMDIKILDLATRQAQKKVKPKGIDNSNTLEYFEQAIVPMFSFLNIKRITGIGNLCAIVNDKEAGIRAIEYSNKGRFRISAIKMPQQLKDQLTPISDTWRDANNPNICYIDFLDKGKIQQVANIISSFKGESNE